MGADSERDERDERDEQADQAEAGAEEKAVAEDSAHKPKKKKGRGKAKADREGALAEVKDHPKAGDSRANLLGHAVIWLGVLGAVAYLMARGS